MSGIFMSSRGEAEKLAQSLKINSKAVKGRAINSVNAISENNFKGVAPHC